MSWIIRKAREADAYGLLDYMQQLSEEPAVHLPLRPGTFNLTPEQEWEWIRQG